MTGHDRFALGLTLVLYFLYFNFVVMNEVIIGSLMEGHFQNQMKQILIDLDIGLLIIELSDLQSHKIIFQGYFYLLPYLKLLAQFQEYLYCQLNLL